MELKTMQMEKKAILSMSGDTQVGKIAVGADEKSSNN